MQTEYWEKLESIFNQASLLPDDETRNLYIEEQSKGNIELQQAVLRLLENDQHEGFFLDEPIFTTGTKILSKAEDENLIKQKEFAQYELIEILGRGGMGVVFLAEDTRLKRLVALKLLPAYLTQHTETVLRFQQEARAASNVAHQNVAYIYDFGQYENRYYLAMEYVVGRSLRELIKEKLIDCPTAIEIALQIASALSAAHRIGIIHRDIKPENVIVMEDGLVKVLDFGLAKITSFGQTETISLKENSLDTTPGLIMGTTAYMSPEQVRGQSVNQTTDVWSLCVVLYEIFTGARPFNGETASDVRAAILRDEPSLSAANIKNNRDLVTVINIGLQKNRLDRFQTIFDLSESLRKIQKGINKKYSTYRLFNKWDIPTLYVKTFVFGVIVLAVLTTILFFLTNNYSPTPNRAILLTDSADSIVKFVPVKSLAVMPFKYQASTDSTKLEFFSLGLTEDLTRCLGEIPDLRVTSFSSTKQVKDSNDLIKISKLLNVEAILQGHIEEIDDQILVTVKLLDLKTGETLWREQMKAPYGELLKLRDASTTVIAGEISKFLQKDNRLILSDYSTRNENAFRVYLEGKYAPDRTTLVGTRRAITKLEEAVRLDPDYSLARVALADAYNLLAAWYGENPDYYFPLALETLEKAIKIDPNLSEAHTSLAKLKMDYLRDFADTESEFKLAIKLNPNNALAHQWYGEVFLSAMGRLDESLYELEIAHQLDPRSSNVLTALAWTRIGRHEYELAVQACDNAIALNSHNVGAYSYKAMALMKLQRFNEALIVAKKASELEAGGTASEAKEVSETEGENLELGVIYVLTGQPEKTQKMLYRLEREKIKSTDISDYDIAVLYAALGKKDRAFQLLEKEALSKSVDLLSIRIDPLLDSMRDDARFAELENKLNLPRKEN